MLYVETPAFVEYIPEIPKKIQKKLSGDPEIANNMEINGLGSGQAAPRTVRGRESAHNSVYRYGCTSSMNRCESSATVRVTGNTPG